MTKKITIGIIALIFGLLVAWQISLQGELKRVSSPETINTAAIQVSEALNGNKKLREELSVLEQQRDTIATSYNSKAEKDGTLSKEVEELKIVTGATNVSGTGVEMVINEQLEITQLVDLINALKNIGAEAIAINNTRIVATTPLSENLITNPLTIKALGNQDILSDSLERRGGIIEQIGSSASHVTKQQNLALPAVKE